MKKTKSLIFDGVIPPEKIAISVGNHQSKTDIGGHSIFLGQVRADVIEGKKVEAIEFSTYREMADEVYAEIREEAFSLFEMTCAHVYHSIGRVGVGELCFFVFTSAKRRKAAIAGCEYFVEQIKQRVPIFGKELLEGDRHQWKENQG